MCLLAWQERQARALHWCYAAQPMDRATLLALDKELLVDLILQLQATVARLEIRLSEVEAELRGARTL